MIRDMKTELPWKIGYGNGITGPSASDVVYLDGTKKPLVTADCPGNYSVDNKLLSQVVCICTGGSQEANAEYIVKSANLFPELVKMLEMYVVSDMRGLVTTSEENGEAIELLKKAKGDK